MENQTISHLSSYMDEIIVLKTEKNNLLMSMSQGGGGSLYFFFNSNGEMLRMAKWTEWNYLKEILEDITKELTSDFLDICVKNTDFFEEEISKDLFFIKKQEELKKKYKSFIEYFMDNDEGYEKATVREYQFSENKQVLKEIGYKKISYTCVGNRYNESIYYLELKNGEFITIPYEEDIQDHNSYRNKPYYKKGVMVGVFFEKYKGEVEKIYNVIFNQDNVNGYEEPEYYIDVLEL